MYNAQRKCNRVSGRRREWTLVWVHRSLPVPNLEPPKSINSWRGFAPIKKKKIYIYIFSFVKRKQQNPKYAPYSNHKWLSKKGIVCTAWKPTTIASPLIFNGLLWIADWLLTAFTLSFSRRSYPERLTVSTGTFSQRQVGWSALPKDTTSFCTAGNRTNNLLSPTP